MTSDHLREIAAIVANIGEPEVLTERILHLVQRHLLADRVALFVRTPDGEIDLLGAIGANGEEINQISVFSKTMLNDALEKGTTLEIPDAQKEPGLSKSPSVKRLNVRSVLAAPLVVQQRTMGLLYVDSLNVPGAFVDSHRDLVFGLAELLAASLEQSRSIQKIRYCSGAPRKPGRGRLTFPNVVGDSRKMQKILRMTMKVGRMEKTVVLTGQPGTGKEVIADLIQQHSRRAKLPYLRINCAAFSPANLESELFGVAAGAFTGVVAREGLFEQANGGTLLLDEIGDMYPESQAAFLRVLEDRFVRRVGGKRFIAVDVRIIASTNLDLEAAVKSGKFRQDLYDRLNQFTIHLPPLREHRDDIPGLAHLFLEKEREREGIEREIVIDPPIMDWLCESPLPGNARELSNTIGKMVALDTDGVLSWDDIPADVRAVRQLQSPKFDEESTFDNMMAIAEASILKRALDNSSGKIRKAARALAMPEATLRRRLKMLDLHKPTMTQMRRVRRDPRKN